MGPSAEYYISAEYHIPVSNVGMTEVKVKVTLSVDRMAVWILPPCSQQRMAAQKCIMGKLGHSDHVGLPVGPVTITACSVAEECLHFPVSSAKSSTSPWKKKELFVSCLVPIPRSSVSLGLSYLQRAAAISCCSFIAPKRL